MATSQVGTSKTASVTLEVGPAQSAGAMLLGHSTVGEAGEWFVRWYGREGYQMTASGNGTLST
jgi:hypothetical protein